MTHTVNKIETHGNKFCFRAKRSDWVSNRRGDYASLTASSREGDLSATDNICGIDNFLANVVPRESMHEERTVGIIINVFTDVFDEFNFGNSVQVRNPAVL